MKYTKIKNTLSSKLFKSAGIYTVTSIINSSIPFFLLPILTRYLTPTDYGIVSMFGVLVSFVSPFTGLNVHGAIARMYYEKDSINIKEYVTNCIYILLSSTFIVAIIFFVFSQYIAEITSVPIRLLWIVVVVSFSQFMVRIVLTLWQVQVKPLQYGIYQVSQTAFNAIFSIILVVSLGYNWRGRIYAQATSLVIFMLIGIIILLKNKWLKFSFNKTYVKHALKFGIPLIPHTLGAVIMTMTDRIFITNMIGVETTGVYTVGYQIGMIINILATSFNQAYTPWLYSKLKENLVATKRKIVKFTYLYFISILLLALLLTIVTPSILKYYVGIDFAQSSIYVGWIAVGYAFHGMYFMVVNYIFYANKNYLLAIITFVSAILNILLNYIFVKSYGAIGAAQATTVVYFIQFLLVWFLANKVHRMPWFTVLLNRNEN